MKKIDLVNIQINLRILGVGMWNLGGRGYVIFTIWRFYEKNVFFFIRFCHMSIEMQNPTYLHSLHLEFSTICKWKWRHFFQKYTKKLLDHSNLGHNGQCRIWNGTKSSNQKYGVICYKHPVHNRWCTMHVHRFSVMLHNRNLAIPQHLDASRLCHNTLCLVPEHISFESHEFNNQRQACVTEGRCLGHPHPLPNCLLNLKM